MSKTREALWTALAVEAGVTRKHPAEVLETFLSVALAYEVVESGEAVETVLEQSAERVADLTHDAVAHMLAKRPRS